MRGIGAVQQPSPSVAAVAKSAPAKEAAEVKEAESGAGEEKPKKAVGVFMAASIQKVQDAKKRAMDLLKEVLASEAEEAPTPQKYIDLQR